MWTRWKRPRPASSSRLSWKHVLAGAHAGPQPPSDDAPWHEALNAFKDREMFRIDMRHILGHTASSGISPRS